MAFDSPAIAGSALYICTTAQTTELVKAGFEDLIWVQIKKIGKFPESGIDSNIVKYDTVDTTVSVKSKGVSTSKDWTVEYARSAGDAGQDALRAAALTSSNYAFKMSKADGTVIYNIGIVTGPTRSGGGPDDVDTETMVIGTNMRDVVVDPS